MRLKLTLTLIQWISFTSGTVLSLVLKVFSQVASFRNRMSLVSKAKLETSLLSPLVTADLAQVASLNLELRLIRIAAALFEAILVLAEDVAAPVPPINLAPKKQNFVKDAVAIVADAPAAISLHESLEVVALAMVDPVVAMVHLVFPVTVLNSA